jgi:hypothetical protein
MNNTINGSVLLDWTVKAVCLSVKIAWKLAYFIVVICLIHLLVAAFTTVAD